MEYLPTWMVWMVDVYGTCRYINIYRTWIIWVCYLAQLNLGCLFSDDLELLRSEMMYLELAPPFFRAEKPKITGQLMPETKKMTVFPWYFPTCPSILTMCDLFLQAKIWKDSLQSYAAVKILRGLWFLCFYSRVRGGWFVRLLISQCLDDWWWFNSCEFWSTGFDDPYYLLPWNRIDTIIVLALVLQMVLGCMLMLVALEHDECHVGSGDMIYPPNIWVT